MSVLDNLPKAYVPPKKLEIGSSLFEYVNVLMEANGTYPILVGVGKERPRVWINIPSNEKGTQWYPLVKDNFSTSKEVLVIKKGAFTTIAVPGANVLKCEMVNSNEIVIKELDLRPLGIDFYLEGEALYLFSNSFFKLTMKNVGVAFGIGKSSESEAATA